MSCAPGPQGGGRALPAVAAIEQQRAGALRPHVLHQRREMRKTADLAERRAASLEVQMREGVRERGSGTLSGSV